MVKTYKLKLYQSKKNNTLNRKLRTACKVYNHCIALHRRYWGIFHRSLKKFRLQKHITKIKKLRKFAYWNEFPSHALQDITDRIDRSYRLFWSNLKRKRKCSPPRFKPWRKYRSFSYNMVGKGIIDGNTIKMAGVKYKFFKSREIEGQVKLLTVKRDACGDFWVYLVCEMPAKDVTAESRLGESIGFDFGFKGRMLIAPDEKDDVGAPDFFRKQAKAIAKASRNLSKKTPRSNNRQKAKLAFARLHRKVLNQRRDYHWKLAHELCRKYSFISFESLNMRWMQASHGRKVGDYGFSEFLSILRYVAPRYGTTIMQVDRFFPSSQLCHDCGHKNPKVKDLNIREWTCPNCGEHHDRDRNAARNILLEGLRMVSA